MICWISAPQAASDGKTLSAFHVNFLFTLLRRGTVFGISYSIFLDLRTPQTHEQLLPFYLILPSRLCRSRFNGDFNLLNAVAKNRSSHRNQVSGPPRCDHHALPQSRGQDKGPVQRLLFA